MAELKRPVPHPDISYDRKWQAESGCCDADTHERMIYTSPYHTTPHSTPMPHNTPSADSHDSARPSITQCHTMPPSTTQYHIMPLSTTQYHTVLGTIANNSHRICSENCARCHINNLWSSQPLWTKSTIRRMLFWGVSRLRK